MWISTYDGLLRWNDGGVVPVTAGLPKGSGFRRIFGHERRLKYLASLDYCLFTREENGWRNVHIPGRSNVNSAYAVLEDSRKRLLVGTLAGLYQVRDGRVR